MWKEFKTFIVKELKLNAIEESNNGPRLLSTLYDGPNILKSRETIITDGQINIYNNIVYPKTGENLPCFGMDLMCFSEKRVLAVWDFQHPASNYDFDHPIITHLIGDMLGNTKRDIRFFESGNHFSRYIYVRKCTSDEVLDHLNNFKRYVSAYKELLDFARPDGTDTQVYKNFDQYMLDLDPVIGYMSNKFGKEWSNQYVNNFLFSYAHK